MNILFAGHQERGSNCLRALVASEHHVIGVLAHPSMEHAPSNISVAETALQLERPLFQPTDVNDPALLASLRALKPDVIVLAGYSQIVRPPFLELAPHGCINLHGGRLPQYRGSSPMHWALINGETTFTISIVQADAGVDTGDVLQERTFPIAITDTIVDLQRTANQAFPEMLLDAIRQIQQGTARARRQDAANAAYYPLRFPNDGLILWDLFTAEQIHNRIRALTSPYSGAFTFFNGRRVTLWRSALAQQRRYGEPGRVYLKNAQGLLVCASDRCLWIQHAVFDDRPGEVADGISRYEKFATLRDAAVANVVAQAWR